MNLWIKSQDRLKLSQVQRLFIEDIDDNNEKFSITDGYCYFGTYKTKERALEVLDEIQITLLGGHKDTPIGQGYISNITRNLIYEMPKE